MDSARQLLLCLKNAFTRKRELDSERRAICQEQIRLIETLDSSGFSRTMTAYAAARGHWGRDNITTTDLVHMRERIRKYIARSPSRTSRPANLEEATGGPALPMPDVNGRKEGDMPIQESKPVLIRKTTVTEEYLDEEEFEDEDEPERKPRKHESFEDVGFEEPPKVKRAR